MTRAEKKALEAYPVPQGTTPSGRAWKDSDMIFVRELFIQGYEQAEKDTITLIESRISEILGDAQPKPALRAELQDIIKRIKEEENESKNY